MSTFIKIADRNEENHWTKWRKQVRKSRLLGSLLVGVMTIGLTGCPHQAMVYNVNDAPVMSGKENISLEQMRRAIIAAGATLGWNMTEASPGKIEGVLFLRSHVAKVDIPYNTKNYSIKYKDSTDLDYDGQKIHSNYNGWIQNLDKAIKTQISLL